MDQQRAIVVFQFDQKGLNNETQAEESDVSPVKLGRLIMPKFYAWVHCLKHSQYMIHLVPSNMWSCHVTRQEAEIMHICSACFSATHMSAFVHSCSLHDQP
jgi:hypothetical protein